MYKYENKNISIIQKSKSKGFNIKIDNYLKQILKYSHLKKLLNSS